MSNFLETPLVLVFKDHDAIMLLMDAETGRLVEANNAALRFYGYTIEQIRSMKIGDINKMPPDELEAERKRAADEKRKHFIVPHLLANGEIRTVEVHTTPIVFEDRKYLFSIIHDITEHKKTKKNLSIAKNMYQMLVDGMNTDIDERRRTEESLRESRAMLKTQFENSPDIIMVIDREYRYLSLNKTLFGPQSVEELIGKNAIMPLPEQVREATKERVDACFETREIQVFEHEVGFGQWARARIVPLPNDGKTERVMIISSDITQQKHTLETLRENEMIFSSFLEHSPVYVFFKDRDIRALRLSRNFEQMLKMPIDQMLGKTMDDLFPSDLSKRMIADDLAVLNEGQRVDVVEEFGGRTYETTKFPILKDGVPFMLAGFTVDITERRQAEEQRQKLEDRLNRVQKLESLGILAGGIAHDFNNLLSGIFGNIEIAVDNTKEESVFDYLTQAMNAIDRARGLTRQLLTFAKGGAPLKKVDRLTPFLQDSVRFALSGSKASSCFSIPEDLWACEYDRTQIGQVIDNLVINAKQAMPEGGVIEISARNIIADNDRHTDLLPGNYIQVSFKDHGIGMSRDTLPKIFDPFYTTKPQGHGIGLAACYSIVHRHGGFIDVESEPGKGSTFHVYLKASPLEPALEQAQPVFKHRGSGTILVMDDEEMIRNMVGNMLKGFGYSVLFAKNGREAAELFISEIKAERRLAAIILDLTVPGGLGGREAIGEIRKQDSQIPVFVASGYSEDPVIASPEKYGFTAGICKPFRRKELVEMLKKHLV
jgi:PAS domain S-box-containing protein